MSEFTSSVLSTIKNNAKAVTTAVAVGAITVGAGVASADPQPVAVTEQVALGAGISSLATILATIVAAAVGVGLGFWGVRAGIRAIRGNVKP